MLLNDHIGRFVLGSLFVGDLVRLGCPCCRLKPATRTPLKPNRTKSPTQRTQNKTTDVVIQQHSRKLLMMDILISETCWVHKKWNKTASNIKLVFYSSDFSLIQNVRPTLRPTQPSVHCVSGLHPPLKGMKQPQREDVSGAEIKNDWSYNSPPAMCLHVVHRDNFTTLHLL